jgi:hypothetical protein
MSRWFRLYADAMRNPKVLKLSDKEFRLWVRLLALASENDGVLPAADEIKLMLNMRLDHLSSALDRLISVGLIDALDVGYCPHNWDKFQYKSDTSTPRVTKHRQKRNVSETPPDTDTDTEVPLSKDNGREPGSEAEFWSSAKAFLGPKAKGDPGAMIGKWLRDHGKDLTIAALNAAQLERAFDPKAYVEGYFKRQKPKELEYAYPLA